MHFRATLKKLIHRDATAPSLSERAAELRGSLTGQTRRTIVAGSVAAAVPLPTLAAPVLSERAEHRARLLVAYAEERQARPVAARKNGWTFEHEAAGLVYSRCRDIAREVVTLPPPKTADELALTAIAASILTEADLTDRDPTTVATVGLARAALAFTGTPLPPGFVGFGDAWPDLMRRADRALYDAKASGRCPVVWAA